MERITGGICPFRLSNFLYGKIVSNRIRSLLIKFSFPRTNYWEIVINHFDSFQVFFYYLLKILRYHTSAYKYWFGYWFLFLVKCGKLLRPRSEILFQLLIWSLLFRWGHQWLPFIRSHSTSTCPGRHLLLRDEFGCQGRRLLYIILADVSIYIISLFECKIFGF
jgi:hypothetical protein